ncbi:Protein kinase-like domain [Pseudocohnilembus persalinus]|uniref:Protein kinase-like domain n=1 Tax=Pseudocohnilembus persalinus TaxID=266149 RepID=A0A0V0QY88_PSEPJ|nr:Protein kinase-like domain [Pseudocohnilembus persalinus]|eukprot:KRX07121.1 Protein kinase-like domain [Pseudocohnilembus persalinus]
MNPQVYSKEGNSSFQNEFPVKVQNLQDNTISTDSDVQQQYQLSCQKNQISLENQEDNRDDENNINNGLNNNKRRRPCKVVQNQQQTFLEPKLTMSKTFRLDQDSIILFDNEQQQSFYGGLSQINFLKNVQKIIYNNNDKFFDLVMVGNNSSDNYKIHYQSLNKKLHSLGLFDLAHKMEQIRKLDKTGNQNEQIINQMLSQDSIRKSNNYSKLDNYDDIKTSNKLIIDNNNQNQNLKIQIDEKYLYQLIYGHLLNYDINKNKKTFQDSKKQNLQNKQIIQENIQQKEDEKFFSKENFKNEAFLIEVYRLNMKGKLNLQNYIISKNLTQQLQFTRKQFIDYVKTTNLVPPINRYFTENYYKSQQAIINSKLESNSNIFSTYTILYQNGTNNLKQQIKFAKQDILTIRNFENFDQNQIITINKFKIVDKQEVFDFYLKQQTNKQMNFYQKNLQKNLKEYHFYQNQMEQAKFLKSKINTNFLNHFKNKTQEPILETNTFNNIPVSEKNNQNTESLSKTPDFDKKTLKNNQPQQEQLKQNQNLSMNLVQDGQLLIQAQQTESTPNSATYMSPKILSFPNLNLTQSKQPSSTCNNAQNSSTLTQIQYQQQSIMDNQLQLQSSSSTTTNIFPLTSLNSETQTKNKQNKIQRKQSLNLYDVVEKKQKKEDIQQPNLLGQNFRQNQFLKQKTMEQISQEECTKLLATFKEKKRIQDKISILQKANTIKQNQEKFQQQQKILEELGQGAHGVVKKCKKLSTGKLYAVKIIRSNDEEIMIASKNCYKLQKLVQKSQYICKTYELFIDEENENIYQVMELITWPNLHSFQNQFPNKQIPNFVAKILAKQISEATLFMHDQGICHRDLKPDNIMINQQQNNYQIKIIDFGISRKFLSRDPQNKFNLIRHEMWSRTGTLCYKSPEMFSSAAYNELCDVWSIGVITYEMLCGKLPFFEEYQTDTIEKIENYDYQFEDVANFKWKDNKEAKDFIKRIFKPIEKRLKAADILVHPWFDIKKQTNRKYKPQDDYKKTTNCNKDFLFEMGKSTPAYELIRLRQTYQKKKDSGNNFQTGNQENKENGAQSNNNTNIINQQSHTNLSGSIYNNNFSYLQNSMISKNPSNHMTISQFKQFNDEDIHIIRQKQFGFNFLNFQNYQNNTNGSNQVEKNQEVSQLGNKQDEKNQNNMNSQEMRPNIHSQQSNDSNQQDESSPKLDINFTITQNRPTSSSISFPQFDENKVKQQKNSQDEESINNQLNIDFGDLQQTASLNFQKKISKTSSNNNSNKQERSPQLLSSEKQDTIQDNTEQQIDKNNNTNNNVSLSTIMNNFTINSTHLEGAIQNNSTSNLSLKTVNQNVLDNSISQKQLQSIEENNSNQFLNVQQSQNLAFRNSIPKQLVIQEEDEVQSPSTSKQSEQITPQFTPSDKIQLEQLSNIQINQDYIIESDKTKLNFQNVKKLPQLQGFDINSMQVNKLQNVSSSKSMGQTPQNKEQSSNLCEKNNSEHKWINNNNAYNEENDNKNNKNNIIKYQQNQSSDSQIPNDVQSSLSPQSITADTEFQKQMDDIFKNQQQDIVNKFQYFENNSYNNNCNNTDNQIQDIGKQKFQQTKQYQQELVNTNEEENKDNQLESMANKFTFLKTNSFLVQE